MAVQSLSKKPLTLLCNRIKILCPDCSARLCDKKLTDDGWLLHIRYSQKGKVTEVFAAELVIKCRECETLNRITIEDSVVESYKNGSTRICGQAGSTECLGSQPKP